MKHIYSILFAFLFAASLQAQPCDFNSYILQPNTVAFAPPAAYSGSQYSFHWDFGDGSSMFADSNVHIYTIQGSYPVNLMIYDTATSAVVCISTDTINLSFCDAGYQQDTLNPSTFNFWANLATFNDAQWDFGDSTFATGANVTHAYTTPGVYTVTMTQIDTLGNVVICSTSFMISYSVLGVCSFNIQSNPTGSIFTLDALVPSSQGTVTWDLGDPNIPTAYGYHMQVGYGNPGTYNICMTYTNGPYSCTSCQQVTVNPSSICSFVAIPDTVNSLLYNFFGNGLGSGTYCVWNFGDGIQVTGGVYESHTYAQPGIYLACMEVHDSLTGNLLCNYCMPLTVSVTPVTCMANYTAVSVGLNAYFINQSVIGPGGPSGGANYLWDFGDGAVSSMQFPQHLYVLPGTYTVCLTIITSACTSTFCDSVVIDTAVVNPTGCTANFIFTQTASYQLVGVNLSSGTNLNFSWDFGDGTPVVSGAYPAHQYASTGVYAVCLTVSDLLGCSDTYCDTLTVDSLGNIIYKGASAGFVLNVLSPDQLASGISDPTPKQIAGLYPVPAHDYINVDWASPVNGTVNYKVISVEGKEMITGNFNADNNRLSTGNLVPGIYLLRIIDNDGSSESRTFIKQ